MARPMFFNVERVRQYLLDYGVVYTVRDHPIEGVRTAVYGSYYKRVSIGDVEVVVIESFSLPNFSVLQQYVAQSGFDSLDEWVNEIKLGERLFLHRATLLPKAPHEGEQARELSVTDYDKLYTLNELRKMCRERGIHPSGDKKALISKLLSQETWDMDEIKSKIQALPPEQRKEILTKYPDLAME